MEGSAKSTPKTKNAPEEKQMPIETVETEKQLEEITENNTSAPATQAKVNGKDLNTKVINEKIIGKPVSGKPWKKINKTSSSKIVKVGLLSRPWEKRKQLAQEHKELKQKIKELKDEDIKNEQERRASQAAKRKRKQENMLKGSSFQLIKNTDKVRKWNKKARAQLTKLPSSMFEALVKKEYGY